MRIILSPQAVKKYKTIGVKDRSKVERKINLLAKNPYLGKTLQGELKGEHGLRAWPLRIIYSIDREKKIIYILNIDYRGNVYKN
jgi:mRNA-degrading endonuclease RelE of RelBE toxin-antitoxin system